MLLASEQTFSLSEYAKWTAEFLRLYRLVILIGTEPVRQLVDRLVSLFQTVAFYLRTLASGTLQVGRPQLESLRLALGSSVVAKSRGRHCVRQMTDRARRPGPAADGNTSAAVSLLYGAGRDCRIARPVGESCACCPGILAILMRPMQTERRP
jgi:hypothetical protein